MLVGEEIAAGWCLMATWRCTPAEAAGLWAVLAFYTLVFLTTVAHSVRQGANGTAARDEAATQRLTNDEVGDLATALLLLGYFAVLVAGCLLWAAAGVQYVHPVQCAPVQLAGAALLVVCMALFVSAHVNMGANWSPEPEQKLKHELVTHGVFRWARHPIYAVFLWGAVGTLLATLNWLFAVCVFGSVLVVFRRIRTEERILTSLFGERYAAYRSRVSALGPPWCCLGFDGSDNYAAVS